MNFTLFISRKLSYPRQLDLPPLAVINYKIRDFVQHGHCIEALQLYSNNPHSPLNTTKFTFPSLLKACVALSNLSYGKIIHSTITTLGLQFDPYIITSLINMYVKCGSLSSAVRLFVKMSESEASGQDVTLWNAIIDGYFRYGHVKEGMVQFVRMQSLGVRPDAYSLSILLGVRDGLLGCMEGRQIHAYILRNMFAGDPFLETALIDMYSNFGRPLDAWHVFEKLEDKKNVVVLNAMIGAFCENGLWGNSLKLFPLAKNGNKLVSASFTGVLTACSKGEEPDFGRQVHSDVIKMGFQSEPYVCTSLLTMYAKCRLIADARKVFVQIPDKKVELWNAMISAYVNNGYAYDALEVYHWMRQSEILSDSFTVSNILTSCSMIESYDFGRMVHGELIKRPVQSNIAVQSALLTMYSKSGRVEDANSVFSTMKEKDLVAWGSMIAGFCQNRKFKEALDLFRVMEADGGIPDSDIIASVISSCMGLENIELGCVVHGYTIKSGLVWDVFVATSIVEMYSKCGFVEMAGNVFSSMLHKNLVAWNSMISCYCRNGLPELSISMFPQILQHGLSPDSVSITSVLAAVSCIAALLKGKSLHGYQIRLEIPSDLQVENAFIDMYIKCGCLKYAQCIFQNLSRRNLVTWNSMIYGYGSHGECHKAIHLFNEMKMSGVKPDDVTFLSLISSCSHSGLVEEGLNMFRSMQEEYQIEPRMEHYVNVVDLLGRAGCLKDAYDFICNMPIEPAKNIWLCFLSACRVHHNLELGELAANKLLNIEPARGSNYAQLLNLYGESEMWDRAAKLRASLKDRGLKKNPGCSWIEVENRVDSFFSGDSSSPHTLEIYKTLSSLRRNIGREVDCLEGIESF